MRCFVAEEGVRAFNGLVGLEELSASDDVLDVSLYYEHGAEVPPAEDFRSLLGHVIFQAESYSEALARWEAIGDLVRLA
ncbi:hypothetical protein [Streptomyces sp. NPDC001719]